ncbi:hypothetical protein Tsubulata_048318, partial [Turnera subulata]
MVGYLVWILDLIDMLMPVVGVYRIPSGSDIPNIRLACCLWLGGSDMPNIWLACCCLRLGYTEYPVVWIYQIS